MSMEQTKVKKIIASKIDKADVKENLSDEDFLNKSADEKQQFIRTILELPPNYEDKIDININNKDIVFKWYLEDINSDSEKLHKNALLCARNGEIDEATQLWQKAASLNPSDPDYYFNLGVAYFEQKKFLDAIDNLTRVLAICPIYHQAHLVLGTAYLKIRKFEFAKKHFKKSILFHKKNAIAYLNLGVVNSILKSYDEGIVMFEKAIELSPKEPRAYLGLAKIYTTLGDVKKANEFFKKVIELDNKGNLANYARRSIVAVDDDIVYDADSLNSKNPEEYYSEGYKCYIKGDYAQSASMYKKYLTLKPEDEYIWYSLGEAQLRAGNPEQALESFKKAIKIHPKKGLYYKELAIVFDKLGSYEKVIAALTKAEEYGKSDSITFCLWGKALYHLKDYDEAITKFEQALQFNKNNFLAKFYLAKTFGDNNQVEHALDHLYELKEIKKDTPIKINAEKLFNKLHKKE